MSQTETGKATTADQRTKATRSFVRTAKTAARRKYTPEEKIRIVLEGFRREVTVSDLCRREGIKPHSYLLVDQGIHGGREGKAYPRQRQPTLDISPVAKKYPLAKPGTKIVFKVRITNGGTGPARGYSQVKTRYPLNRLEQLPSGDAANILSRLSPNPPKEGVGLAS